MGRELTDARITHMLTNNMQLEAYIQRGQSEIHWEGEKGKQKHLDLITKVSKIGYREMVLDIIGSIKNKYQKKNDY